MRALEMKSFEQVHAAIQACPSAAKELFWDHDFEPPLCCAVRCECSAAIVNFLLEHGADPEAQNVRSRTPAQILGHQPRQIAPPMFLGAEWAAMLPVAGPPWQIGGAQLFAATQEQRRQEIADLQTWHQEVAELLNRQV